jgi:hypothetical protein
LGSNIAQDGDLYAGVNGTGGFRTCAAGALKSHYLQTGKTRHRTCVAGAFKSQRQAEPVGRPVFSLLQSRKAHVTPPGIGIFAVKSVLIYLQGRIAKLLDDDDRRAAWPVRR